MPLTRLEISSFRNLNGLTLEPGERFNCIYGVNGSGKTSILEAIYFLGMGRSFRSHHSNRMIQHGSDKCCVYGSLVDESGSKLGAGIERHRQTKTRIRINGETETSIAQLARLLPLQVLNQASFHLVDAGPQYRRQFMDWGVFHVEPGFFSAWKALQRVLQQRNAALKLRTDERSVRLWDAELVKMAEQIDGMRARYIEKLAPAVCDIYARIGRTAPISLEYARGWDFAKDLQAVLDGAFLRDRMLGYTQYGPQRADLIMKIEGIAVEELLSRGEQKLLFYALQLAQGFLLRTLAGRKCFYLIDDLSAELDAGHITQVITLLSEMNAQVFITSIDPNVAEAVSDNTLAKVFHVEQGKLTEKHSAITA